MRPPKAYLRLTTVLALSLTAYAAMILAGTAVDVARRIGGKRRKACALRGKILRLWAGSLVRTLKVRIETTGTPPEPPFFLVSNHLSYLDVVVYGSQVPCVFVARGDLADWPVAGRLSRSAGTVYIDRGRKRDIPRVLGRIDEVLADGAGVIVFPEGTSSSGEKVLPFRASLLDVPARDATPVSWAAISYEPVPGAPPPHLTVCWWGGMPFGSHAMALMGLPEIRAVIAWGDAPIVDRDRKTLATRLHSAVDRRFRPVVSGSPLLGGGEAR